MQPRARSFQRKDTRWRSRCEAARVRTRSRRAWLLPEASWCEPRSLYKSGQRPDGACPTARRDKRHSRAGDSQATWIGIASLGRRRTDPPCRTPESSMSMGMSSSFVLGHSFVIRHWCFVIFTLLPSVASAPSFFIRCSAPARESFQSCTLGVGRLLCNSVFPSFPVGFHRPITSN